MSDHKYSVESPATGVKRVECEECFGRFDASESERIDGRLLCKICALFEKRDVEAE